MNTKARLNELMNQEIDGVNSQSESNELNEYLTKHQDARSEYADLMELKAILSKSEELIPSQNLLKRVMIAVTSLRGDEARQKSTVSRIFASRLMPVFAMGLAAGVVIITVTFTLLNKADNLDLTTLVGTIANEMPVLSTRQIASADIQKEGVREVFTIMTWKQFLVAEVTVDALGEHEMTVTFDPSELRVKGFVDFQEGGSRITVDNSFIRFSTAGRHKYKIIFEGFGRASALGVQTSDGQKVIDRTTIALVR